MNRSTAPYARPPLIGALLTAAVLAWGSLAHAQAPSLTGTATYRERMALPENAAFEATVRDVTRPDLPAELIGRTRIEPVQGLPIRFAIPYDPRLVQYGHRYTLQARIIADGRLLFATVDPIPVFVDGQPTPVEVVLPRGDGLVVTELPPPAPSRVAPSRVAPATVVSGTGLGPLPATYEGVMPCADCAGIRHTLRLEPGGPFTLHYEYLGKRGEPGYDLTGHWLYDADARILTLSSDRERPLAFAVRDASTLRLLDVAGRPIVSDLNYDLTRSAAATVDPGAPATQGSLGAAIPAYPPAAYSGAVGPAPALASPSLATPSLSPPSIAAPPPPAAATGAPVVLSAPGTASAAGQTLRGVMRRTATGTGFAECGSGQPLPIAPQGQGGQLEAAYQRAGTAPGEEILAEVEGRIAFGPLPGGTNLGRVLIVDRFVGLHPGEGCAPPPATAWVAPASTGSGASTDTGATDIELRNTYWRLAMVRSQRVTAAPGLEQPNLVLNPDINQFSGSGGCNGIGGKFTLDGGHLTFDLGPSTMRACEGGMEQERAYRTELGRAVGWSIEGDRLTLYDAQGASTLRFEAGYR